MDPSARHTKDNVHHFVQSFLPNINQNTDVKLSKLEILQGITYRFRNDMSKIDKLSFEISDEFKNFLDYCKFIAELRGCDFIIPKVIKYTYINKCLQYCLYTKNDIYYTSGEVSFRIKRIPNAEDLKYQQKFIDSIKEELLAFVLSPDHIHYWIHLGHDVNLENFSNTKIY